MIKKIMIIFMLFFTINSIYAGYNYNSSYTNITLESNGWCANLEITFQLWNQSDYENKKEIENKLCEPGCQEDCDDEDGPDCVKCRSTCQRFHFVEDANVKIYDGPMDSLTVLFDGKTNETGHFKYTFDKPQQHLLEIYADKDTHYNDYHQIYDLYECGAAQGKTIKTTDTAEDISLEYDSQGIILEVQQSLIKNKSDFVIDESIDLPKELTNKTKHFEITASSSNFSSLTMKINVENLSAPYTVTTLFRYNPSTRQWTEINFEKQNTQMSFDASPLGIYAITQETEEPIIEDVIEENVSTSETNNDINEDTNSSNNQSSSSGISKQNLIIGGIVISCIILLVIIFALKGKKGTGHYHAHREEKDDTKKEDKHVLTTYEATYQQAQKYVREHKEGFSKDALYRALEGANVPKDIIDKVFNQEL